MLIDVGGSPEEDAKPIATLPRYDTPPTSSVSCELYQGVYLKRYIYAYNSSFILTDVKLVQPLNVEEPPMLVTLFGIVMDVKPVHP